MARPQTVFSELQVAMGITTALNKGGFDGINNVRALDVAIWSEEYDKRKAAHSRSPEQLIIAGAMIGEYLTSQGITNFEVDWEGGNTQSAENRVAVDLFINPVNLRVSVKENARIVVNAAPATIFDDVLHGKICVKKRRDDWFMRVANEELDAYFLAVHGDKLTGEKTVKDFYHNNERENRKIFSKQVAVIASRAVDEYTNLIQAVALKSAEIFNAAINPLLYEPYLYYFFRINAVPHILAGLEDDEAFAVLVPGATQFNKQFRLKNLTAIPNKAGQAEVKLHFKIEELATGKLHDLYQRIEIRWSHGKFCGSPEAKVYSHGWKWSELPWVTNLGKNS